MIKISRRAFRKLLAPNPCLSHAFRPSRRQPTASSPSTFIWPAHQGFGNYVWIKIVTRKPQADFYMVNLSAENKNLFV